MTFKSPPNRILSNGTHRAVAISTAVSPEQGMITSFALLLLSFEPSISVLLSTCLMISDLYLVYNSPYRIHGSPSSESCSLGIPIPFDKVAILSNSSSFHSPLNSVNLKWGTLRFFEPFIFSHSAEQATSFCSRSIEDLRTFLSLLSIAIVIILL